MLRNVDTIRNFTIQAVDGKIGHVKDFYFDDAKWVMRYLIVDTGNWLWGRHVLISPFAITHLNWVDNTLSVSLYIEDVQNSPVIDSARPVSRQQEMQHLSFYGYPNYWGGPELWGAEMYPDLMLPGFADALANTSMRRPRAAAGNASEDVTAQAKDDPHLRSKDAVVGYHLVASDGEIGHVQGLLFDDETWAIRYLVMDTSNWWMGHKVIVSPDWIESVDWASSTVTVRLTRQAVKDSPPYDFSQLLNREQEMALHQHYGKVGYWE